MTDREMRLIVWICGMAAVLAVLIVLAGAIYVWVKLP